MGRILITLALILLPATHSLAAIIGVYTDRALWEADAGAIQTEDFNNVPLGFLQPGTTQLGLVSFYYEFGPSSSGPEITTESTNNVNGTPYLNGHVYKTTGASDPRIHRFIFPHPVTAWGADFVDTLTGAHIQFEFADQTIKMSSYYSNPGDGFLGVTTDTPFTELTIRSAENSSSNAEFFGLDDLSFSLIPEPNTMILALFGSVGLISKRKAQSRS